MPKGIKRSSAGQTKHGSARAGTHASHIMSFEVMNSCYRNSTGRPMSRASETNLVRAMNSSSNLRIKSTAGNLVTDRTLDSQIMRCISNGGGNLTNRAAVNRVARQWDSVKSMNIPDSQKRMVRDSLSQVKDQNGNSIVRKNAALY